MTTAITADEHGQEQDGVPPEDIPSGRFGGPLPTLPAHITPCTPEEQAAHLTELAEALSCFAVGDAIRRLSKRKRGVA
ncbi:hypothetical protein [Streptomyces neyagawaensis]|uniref:hypothetical protein n=1 Tax=Streptomyces neyagawaensis TaxID=42238 RepID=UPI00201D232A|nr:hypothetical protein [Streptomyces neyagawaensis]MCL6733327.1 hypothetical protein [Streptomyces neyagawaensis]MDE1685130.1 hypothetical protein [Streptomyces neyagawaensis]